MLTERKVKEIIKDNWLTKRQIASKLGVPEEKIEKYINNLNKKGQLFFKPKNQKEEYYKILSL